MTVGIVGAGQLGRMLALAGYPLGLDFLCLDPARDAPAGQVAPLLHGKFTDRTLLKRLARGVQTQEIEPQRITRQSEHAAELAGAHDADRHVRGVARGSGLPSTPAVWRSR